MRLSGSIPEAMGHMRVKIYVGLARNSFRGALPGGGCALRSSVTCKRGISKGVGYNRAYGIIELCAHLGALLLRKFHFDHRIATIETF